MSLVCWASRFGIIAAVAVALACASGAARAQGFQSGAPTALLMDAETRTVLYEKGADDLVVPASTVKIMTAELVFRDLTSGRLKLDDTLTISEKAWRLGGSGGSSMFAQLNSRVRVEDLLRGLIVQSGNDAAVALAEGVAGSEDNFATMMTQRARELGLKKSTFRNAWGGAHPEQRVTAREMAQLSLHVIKTYPSYYKYFSEREFTWNKIRQLNRNPLLLMDIGADGLKTGNIDDSGFGMVGSAVDKESGQRLVAVIYGARTAKDRGEEARKLLNLGMRGFESRLLFKAGEEVGAAQVFGGAVSEVPLAATEPVRLLTPRASSERLNGKIVYNGPLVAPIEPGQEVARLKIWRGATLALDAPLMTTEAVPLGPLHKRAWDAGVEYVTTLFRKHVLKR